MTTIGVVCPFDDSYQTFQRCIDCHENRSRERNCHVPVYALKAGRDNAKHRQGAGVSMSTLIGCPRAYALLEQFEFYEPVIATYNKARGTLVHAMFELDNDPPDWIIREQRLYANVSTDSGDIRVSGQPDLVDLKYHVLEDYKSKDNIPLRPDERHEFQFNGYRYLLKRGKWAKNHSKGKKDEDANIDIHVIGAHYVTFKTKTEKAWLKMTYPLWDLDETQDMIIRRATPIVRWQRESIMPACDPYVSGRWLCDCEKHTQQLIDRGVCSTSEEVLNEATQRKKLGV